MQRKKLNCIWTESRRWTSAFRGLLALALVVALSAASALAAGDGGAIPQTPLQNKPEVTIQGNVVVDDSGAPTGFYELALCVRSPKRIYGPDPADFTTLKDLSEAEYATALAAIEAGTSGGVTEGDYQVTYYPFSAASAVVGVNVDVLTAVNWDVEQVTYSDWDGTAYAADDAAYPRGIDLTPTTGGNFDPDVWAATDPDPFPDVTRATLKKPSPFSVALDAEGDRSAFTAAAQVDDYYENAATSTKAAIVTLSAHAPDNKPVVYKTSTPVAVIRFAYDLKRFPKNTVMVNGAFNAGDLVNQITGEANAANAQGFWLGKDRATGYLTKNGKTPLTWLADTAMDTAGPYSFSDSAAAATEAGQVVWTKLSSQDTAGAPVDWRQTEYYYYLGANGAVGGSNAADPDGSVDVSTAGGIQTVEHVRIPDTQGVKILAPGTLENPTPGAGDSWTAAAYSYYVNILHLDGPAEGRGLRLEMVNAPTFRAPRGSGGKITILYYDYTDELIGAQVVKGGDVRKEVNSYVERNFIAPELRASQYLKDGELSTDPADLANYENVVNSLDREFTYRGSKYPYLLNGGDGLKDAKGDNYPLTNKLDYVFYKRLNIVNTLRIPDPKDPTNPDMDTVENYYTVAKPNDDPETGKYPYIYGWAIVEDPANTKIEVAGENWEVLKDSVRTRDTWTTFGSGELLVQKPDYTDRGSPVQALPIGTVETQPGLVSAPLVSPVHYDYKTSSADDNGYLRFADFSDIDALLKDGQDVLIVKAVYEPGTDLLPDEMYTTVEDSLYVTRYGENASTLDSTFSFQYQYQRATDLYGDWQGVKRVREPALQAALTYDVNAFDTEEKDLNPSSDAKAFFVQMIAENKDVIDIDLTAGGVIWRVDYILADLYSDFDIATGTKRSSGGELNLKNNFNYVSTDDSGDSIPYSERQGTDGFVTQGTLHQLMEVATAAARGNTTNQLTRMLTLPTVNDLNLRFDENTTITALNRAACVTYTQNLVNAIVAAYPDPATAPAGIYNKKGNVELTWHQLQRHIVMSNAGNTAGIFDGTSLMSDSDCAGFTWCRMDNCAGDIKMDINTASDVLTALYMIQTNPTTSNEYKKAYEAIYGNGSTSTGVTAGFLKGFGYRIQADGVPYDYDSTITDAALKAAILRDLDAAVASLAPILGSNPDWTSVTWEEIQEEIIWNNMGADTPAILDLWWKPSDGKPYGTPPIPSTWEEVLKYSYQEYVGVDLDGDGTPDAKIPHKFERFTSTNIPADLLDWMIGGDVEGQSTGDYADMGWFRKGLDSNDECVKFTDADEFAAAWIAAIEVLSKPVASGGGGYSTPDKLKLASWEEIQYALLTYEITGTAIYKPYADIMAETSGTVTGGPLEGKELYWNDGGEPKIELEDLLVAVSEYAFKGSQTKLNKILSDGIGIINDEFYFRKTDPMGKFDSVDEFKRIVSNALTALYRSGSDPKFLGADGQTLTMEWEEFQWLLLNYQTMGTQPDKDTILADPSIDYWWKDGGSPTKAVEIKNVTDLFMAALWVKEGVLSIALDNLTVQDLTDLGIWKDERGIPFPATMTQAQAIQMVKNAVANFPYTSATVGGKSEDDLKKELQYAIFHGNAYLPAGSITDTYWWQGTGGPAITDQESLLKAAWLYFVGDGAGTTTSRALDAMPKNMDFINDRDVGLAMRSDSEGTAFADMDAFLTVLDTVLNSGITYDEAISMTNYQLQYMLLGGAYKSDADVKAEVIDTGDPDVPKDSYWWFTMDEKPDYDTRTEIPLDEAKWNDFIWSVGDYATGWDGSYFTFSPLNNAVIRDVLLLRADESGTLIDTADFFNGNPDGGLWDMIIETVVAIANSDGGSDYFDPGSYEMYQPPSWYQFQYCLIHRNDLTKMPSDAEAKAECKEKYEWKYDDGSTPPTPPDPTREEIPLDEAKWNSFITSAGAYYEMWDSSYFKFSPMNDKVIRDELLLRANDAGAEIRASDFYAANPSAGDLIISTLDAISNASNGAEFIDPATYSMIKAPTWYQFQYALIHRNDLTTLPNNATCKAECEAEWNWKYRPIGSGGEEPGPGPDPKPPEPTKTEIKVDAAIWNSFIRSAGDYYELWSAAAFTFSPMTDEVVKDTLLLRADDSGTVLTASELFAGDPDAYDIIMETLDAIAMSGNGGDYIDGSTYAMIKAPTWHQFQYAIIHRGSLSNLPDDATCKAECEAKWDWKYTTSGGGGSGGEDPDPPTPPETKTEIPVDAATWNSFMRSAGDYYELWSASAFTFSPMTDEVVKDTLLLRADDSGTVLTAAELFAGDPDAYDIIMETMDAISMCGNGGDYIDGATYALIKVPTWYQFQYAIIHRASLSSLPDDATCKAECEAKWDWKYGTSSGSGGGSGGEDPNPPTPSTKTEIAVDPDTWDSFIQSAGAYYEMWSADEFTFALDDGVVQNTLLLRADDSGTVLTAAELFAGDPDAYDIIMETMDAISMCGNGGDYIDGATYALIKPLTWYQFQYAIIHRGSLSSLPDDATCKAECEAKWDWKYTTS